MLHYEEYSLKLMVRTSLYDIKTGKIIQDPNANELDMWKSQRFTSNNINKYKTDHPLKVNGKTKKLSRGYSLYSESMFNDYIEFRTSNLYTDSGQTPVPFWDAQIVAPVPAVPLVGVGFIWRSVHNSGGFIAPMVIPFDYSQFLNEIDAQQLESMIMDYKETLKINETIIDQEL